MVGSTLDSLCVQRVLNVLLLPGHQAEQKKKMHSKTCRWKIYVKEVFHNLCSRNITMAIQCKNVHTVLSPLICSTSFVCITTHLLKRCPVFMSSIQESTTECPSDWYHPQFHTNVPTVSFLVIKPSNTKEPLHLITGKQIFFLRQVGQALSHCKDFLHTPYTF